MDIKKNLGKTLAIGTGYIVKKNLPKIIAGAGVGNLAYKKWKKKKVKKEWLEIDFYLEYLNEQGQPPSSSDMAVIGKRIGNNISKGMEKEKEIKPEPSVPSVKRDMYENEELNEGKWTAMLYRLKRRHVKPNTDKIKKLVSDFEKAYDNLHRRS